MSSDVTSRYVPRIKIQRTWQKVNAAQIDPQTGKPRRVPRHSASLAEITRELKGIFVRARDHRVAYRNWTNNGNILRLLLLLLVVVVVLNYTLYKVITSSESTH